MTKAEKEAAKAAKLAEKEAAKTEVSETADVEPVAEPEQESAAKIAYRALIENYKKVSPKKYEMKKAELEAKLNAIK